MRTVFNIALNDLRLFFANRGNLFGLVLVPVALTLLIGYFFGEEVYGEESQQLRIDVIDHDRSEQSLALLDTLRETNSDLVLCPMDNDAEDLCQLEGTDVFDVDWTTTRVSESISLAALEIPEGFGEQLEAFEPVEITYISDEEFGTTSYIRQVVDAAIQRMNGAVVASRVGIDVVMGAAGEPLPETDQAALSESLYARAKMLWADTPSLTRFELSSAGGESGGNSTGALGQSVPGMGSTFVMLTVLGGMTALMTERREWTLQRLAVMPVSRAQLLGGKILGRFSLGMIQYLVVFAVGIFARMNFGSDLAALVLIMVAYTLCITALSFALGSHLENEAQAAGLSNLVALVFAPLGGAWWPLEIVPRFMRLIGHISPVAWAMDGYNALIFENGSLADVLLPVSVLFVLAAALFGVGILGFKYE